MPTLQSRLADLTTVLGADMKSKVSRGEGWLDLRKQTGVVGDGTADDSTAINNVFISAASLGFRVYGYGTFRINSTVNINSECDLSQATFNYYGSGIAIQVGVTTGVTYRLKANLPSVRASNKVGNGWSLVVGTKGVRLVNTHTSVITIPRILNFETGLMIEGVGQGNVYNKIDVGIIENCKIGQDILSDATGWSNENWYRISYFSYYSNEGAVVAGTRCIRTQNSPSMPNNNVWLGGSVEGNTAEYHMEIAGGENRFLHMRWENSSGGGCRILWKDGSFRNTIDHGYGSHQLIHSYETTAGTPTTLSGQGWKIAHGAGTKGVLQLENTSSSTNPAVIIHTAGGIKGNTDPATGYAGYWSADRLALKRSTDAFDRVNIDALNGRIYFGNGAAASDRYIGNYGTTTIGVTNAHFAPTVTATKDLGLDANRWQDVYLSRHLRLNTVYIRDNAGVLETSVNGTTWTVLGATVLPDVDFLADVNAILNA